MERRAEDPRVTVVVASRNRRPELLRTLGEHRAHVILVDNGSTDGTVAAVRRAHPRVQVIPLPRNRGAAARTIGVRHARTPFVAFADDDSWWAPGALARAAEHLSSHASAAVIQGRILVGTELRVDPVCAQMAAAPLGAPRGLPGPRVLGFLACGVVVRRSAFLAIGGFDDVIRFPGEEERVAWDLAAAGHDLLYCADVVAHHHPSPRRTGAARRRRAETRSSTLSAVMRLPWGSARDRLSRAWRQGRDGRLGVLAGLPRLPAALASRSVLPERVLAQINVLDSGGSR